jgi:hypothetical protein
MYGNTLEKSQRDKVFDHILNFDERTGYDGTPVMLNQVISEVGDLLKSESGDDSVTNKYDARLTEFRKILNEGQNSHLVIDRPKYIPFKHADADEHTFQDLTRVRPQYVHENRARDELIDNQSSYVRDYIFNEPRSTAPMSIDTAETLGGFLAPFETDAGADGAVGGPKQDEKNDTRAAIPEISSSVVYPRDMLVRMQENDNVVHLLKPSQHVKVGMYVRGAHLSKDTRVLSVDGTTVTLSEAPVIPMQAHKTPEKWLQFVRTPSLMCSGEDLTSCEAVLTFTDAMEDERAPEAASVGHSKKIVTVDDVKQSVNAASLAQERYDDNGLLAILRS